MKLNINRILTTSLIVLTGLTVSGCAGLQSPDNFASDNYIFEPLIVSTSPVDAVASGAPNPDNANSLGGEQGIYRGQFTDSGGQTYPSNTYQPNNAFQTNPTTPGSSDLTRYPMSPSGNVAPIRSQTSPIPSANNTQNYNNNFQRNNYQPPAPAQFGTQGTSENSFLQNSSTLLPQDSGVFNPAFPTSTPPSNFTDSPYQPLDLPGRPADLIITGDETQTGRFMIGAGVNSDAGVTGQIVIDERHFDYRRYPTSFQDFIHGEAFRGGGQGFRIEAMPGTQVQRYLVSFTEPYLLGYMPISFRTSGFFFNRRFQDWDEERLGGRMALGYRVTHDLSIAGSIRGEKVEISDPRIASVPELSAAVGTHDLFSGRVTLTHDTRDIPFAPTEGSLIELSLEQVFGSFDYPRAELELQKHFLIRERPDGSGRHTLSFAFDLGFTGSQTPIFENFFAGGHTTMRGFDFRGASPTSSTVIVGGEFKMLGSVEYLFPLTADDMIKGVVFCDFGTIEESISIHGEDFRVAPGIGLRLNIPAMGPAPLALDLAVPISREDTDDIQNFSFFFGFARN